MKIVYISQYYYPEPHSIHTELAETLSSYGHEVTVVTAYPNYPLGRIYDGWKQKFSGQWEHINGVSVLRCPIWSDHSKSIFFRGLHYFSFTVSATLLIFFRVPSADVFLVHHPPPSLAIPAWLFNKRGNCPFVFRIADLWPEFIAGSGVSKNKALLKIVDVLLRLIYRAASHVIVPSPGFEKRLVDKGVAENKITFVSNYADESIYYPQEKDKELQQKLGIKESDIIIMYAGNIGQPQRIDVLINSMKRVKHRPEIKLFIIGDGHCKKKLQQTCLQEGIESVVFFDQMSPEDVNRYYSVAAALFIQLEDQLIWTDTIPSKIYAYMLAGRPIIAALKGDGADVVAAAQGGGICEPCNDRAIADCVVRFADMPGEEREQMGKNNYKYVMSNFSKNIMTKKIEAVLQKAMNGKSVSCSAGVAG
ncbi:glycosyltransferase family 4 protein [Thermodesulfobacteriota bacterium]